MLKHMFPDYTYLTFDDPEEELAFNTDPKGFMARFTDNVILDEVQRVPNIFRYLKMTIDKNPEILGRFILTGSNQLQFQKNISESLSGRVGLLCLLPFEHSEIPSALHNSQILYGGYPALVLKNNKGAREWFASYISTYLEKNIRLVFDIGKLVDFQIFIKLIAARTSQEQNDSSLAKEIGVSANTITKWHSVLQAGYITFALAPFHANIGKRLIKRSKIYFWDTGLVSYLTGITSLDILYSGPLSGGLFENLVIAEIIKKDTHSNRNCDFWFYRDNGGNEVDLIMHDKIKNHVTYIEIKSGFTAKTEWVEKIERISELIHEEFKKNKTTSSIQIIYRGETKKSWPKKGVDFINIEDALT